MLKIRSNRLVVRPGRVIWYRGKGYSYRKLRMVLALMAMPGLLN